MIFVSDLHGVAYEFDLEVVIVIPHGIDEDATKNVVSLVKSSTSQVELKGKGDFSGQACVRGSFL